MKIGLYTPFKSIVGGGEKYLLTIAEALSANNEVELTSSFYYDMDYFSRMLGINLQRVKFRRLTNEIFAYLPPYYKKFDLFFCLTNHLNPPVFSLGKKGLLIVQFPFPYPERNLKDKILKSLGACKLSSYNAILCYSRYVKNYIDQLIYNHKQTLILNPSINYREFRKKDKIKENIILSVGRFFQKDHNKNFPQLIDAFKKIKDKAKTWEYHMAGFVDAENKKFFKYLEKESEGYPIILHENLDFNKLRNLYQKSKIFWHATGLYNNENLTPEKSEHFGLSVVEAMAAGNVPLVTNKGALPEIVQNKKCGYLFDNIKQLIELTKRIIYNPCLLHKLQQAAGERAKKYDKEIFKKKLEKIIKNLFSPNT